MTQIRRLLRGTRGIGTIEYALVAMLISVGAVSAYASLGAKVQSHWGKTYETIIVYLN